MVVVALWNVGHCAFSDVKGVFVIRVFTFPPKLVMIDQKVNKNSNCSSKYNFSLDTAFFNVMAVLQNEVVTLHKIW